MAQTQKRSISNVLFLKRLYAAVSESTSVNVISPLGLAVVSFGFMVLSIFIPPSWYEDVVHEPDLMFMNGHVFVFYTACILSMLASYYLIRFDPPKFRVLRSAMSDTKPNLWLMVLAPLLLAMAVGILTILLILASNPSLIGDILSGHGAEAKANINMKDNLGGMSPFVLSILNYTQVRIYQCERALQRQQLRICRIVWWATFCVAIATALVKLARYEAIPIVLSWLIIALRTRGSGYSAWYSIRGGLLGGVVILGLFSLFAALRGAEAFQSLMGYGPASFNHLAALLSGRLQLMGGGTHTFAFIDHLPFMHRISDVQILPYDLADEFKSEFPLTRAAGLNSQLIWVTAYGYYYADWGYGALVVTSIIGLVTAISWKSFNFQRAWGCVMYPWLASLTLLSMTSGQITQGGLPIMVIMGLLLEGWDRLPMWQHNVSMPSKAPFRGRWRQTDAKT